MLDVYAIDLFLRRIKFGSGKEDWRNWDDSGDITLMQFTGLFDKNGKEIYEGDIVEAMFRYSEDKENKPPKNKTKFVVEFKIDPGTQYCGFNFFPSVLNTIKVIGNVYENPELLNA